MYYFPSKKLRHIPASTSSRWDVTKQIDAGTLQFIDNNLSVYAIEHGRTLATQTGGICNIMFKTTNEASKRGFSQSAFPAPISFSSAPTHRQLAWGNDVAMRFGPFYLPSINAGTLRNIIMPIEVPIVIIAPDNCSVYCCVNDGINPYIGTTNYAIEKINFVGSAGTKQLYTFKFRNILEKVPREMNVIAVEGTTATTQAVLTGFYVWVGIYRNATTTNIVHTTIGSPRIDVT